MKLPKIDRDIVKEAFVNTLRGSGLDGAEDIADRIEEKETNLEVNFHYDEDHFRDLAWKALEETGYLPDMRRRQVEEDVPREEDFFSLRAGYNRDHYDPNKINSILDGVFIGIYLDEFEKELKNLPAEKAELFRKGIAQAKRRYIVPGKDDFYQIGQSGKVLDSLDGYLPNFDPKPEVKVNYEWGLENWLKNLKVKEVSASEISNRASLIGFKDYEHSVRPIVVYNGDVRGLEQINHAKEQLENRFNFPEHERKMYEKGIEASRRHYEENGLKRWIKDLYLDSVKLIPTWPLFKGHDLVPDICEHIDLHELSELDALQGFKDALQREGILSKYGHHTSGAFGKSEEQGIEKIRKFLETNNGERAKQYEKGLQLAEKFMEESAFGQFRLSGCKQYGINIREISEEKARDYFNVHREFSALAERNDLGYEGVMIKVYPKKRQETLELLNAGDHDEAEKLLTYQEIVLSYLRKKVRYYEGNISGEELLTCEEKVYDRLRKETGRDPITFQVDKDDPEVKARYSRLKKFNVEDRLKEFETLREDIAKRRQDRVYDLKQRIDYFAANEKYELAAKARDELKQIGGFS